jgi:hypothetical protein
MKELQVGGMQCHAGYSAFRGLVRAVLAIADNRVSQGCQLYSDLILQSRD